MIREDEILKIRDETESCRKCELHKTRKNTVPGEGSLDSKIMFIGDPLLIFSGSR